MEHIARVMLTEQEIKTRVKELANQIERDYNGESLTLICVLSGASIFFADLVRELNLDARFEFMSVSSYGSGTVTSGEVKILKDINRPIAGKHVMIVEDIIDTGCTLNYLKNVLLQRQPLDVKVCTILDKPSRRRVEFAGDYVGFTIPDEFVVGYGLDYDGKYRNLKDVCVLSLED